MTSKYLANMVAPLDALLLKGDADPATRAIMTTALVLNHEPEFERLADSFERASRAVPRMRQRVATQSWTPGHAEWVADDEFDVTHHVHRVGAPGDRTLRAVIEMVSDSATAPFDPARPLWSAVLVNGLVDGRAVLVLRAHHAIADGVRALHMMASLLDVEESPSGPELPTLDEPKSGATQAIRRLARTASHATLSQQQRAGALARTTFNATLRPVKSLSDAAAYARSALRTYGSAGAEPSPLLRSRSRSRRFGVIEIPLDDMRRAAKSQSATVNDVFLAGLLGGVQRYHHAFGLPEQDVPISFPIDVSGDNTPESGNHFSAAVIPGPSSIGDPAARIRAVHELVASRRSEPGVDAAVRFAPILHQAPSWLAAAGMTAYARRVDLQASNIIGPDFSMYLSGSKVERFYAFGPLPGVPVMAVLVSYEGVCTLGFTMDPAAVTDPQLFIGCTRDAFDELFGANRSKTPTQE